MENNYVLIKYYPYNLSTNRKIELQILSMGTKEEMETMKTNLLTRHGKHNYGAGYVLTVYKVGNLKMEDTIKKPRVKKDYGDPKDWEWHNEEKVEKFGKMVKESLVESFESEDIDEPIDEEEKEIYIDKLMNTKFKDDDPKYDYSNRSYLSTLSLEELEYMYNEWNDERFIDESLNESYNQDIWYGVDKDLETSLMEYQFVAKQPAKKDYNDEWYVLYKVDEDQFGTGWIRESDLNDIVEKRSWANKKDILSFLDTVDSTINEWLTMPFVNKLSDLISYFGIFNILGDTYHTIDTEEALKMIE